MKSILTILAASVIFCTSLSAQMLTESYTFTEPFSLSHVSMRDMLEYVARWSGKQVVVASEDDLKPVISLILPSPVSGRTVRKVIDSLLLLEGYEMVDTGETEIHLHRILTPEQCSAINKGIGHIRIVQDRMPTRDRVAVDSRGVVIPTKELVIIRPSIQREAERPGAGHPDTKPEDKVPAEVQPSSPTSKNAPR